MRKIILLLLIFFPYITFWYDWNYQIDEKKYCESINKYTNWLSIYEDKKNNSYDLWSLMIKYSHLDPLQRNILIEQEKQMINNEINNIKSILNNEINIINWLTSKNNNLLNIDCYPLYYKTINSNNTVSISKTYIDNWYLSENSNIVVEWQWFNNSSINNGVSIYFIIWKYQYWLDWYNLVSNNKITFHIPKVLQKTPIKSYRVKYCIWNNCIYSNIIDLNITKDTYSYEQYYLTQLNIPNAWNKVKNNKEVIVAIIDDGININHPDLLDNIWTHPKAKYWDSKIIDFVWDWLPANLPVWEHGTMIAWIIWAKQNNNEWIAWIAKNIKFMPLRVFDSKGNAKEENIIKAIEYAIDNWANIINLSLWSSQFNYSTKYDIVIKKAFDKWVTVVISAWNWDILSWQNTWINLTNNPISPVCNNGWKYKYSIWVSATDLDGYRTNWTNYWNCAQFFVPWVWIISTSIPVYNSNYGSNYNIADWTSYSAPIISWIVALWYNQYWYVSPIDVYEALEKSKVKDEKVWYKIDASKYIDILWEKNKTQKEKQVIIDNENEQKQKAEFAFNQIKKKLSKLSETKRKATYNSILKQLNWFKWKVKWDKEIILNHLIFLVNEELGINQWDDLKDLFWDLFNK